VPTLRNIALSAPYMHDGRFKTLEEVVEFYASGIQAHPNLHSSLRSNNGDPKRLNISSDDKQALVAFLHTLTDDHMLSDTRFSDPFKK
jgi:cytochrome c peroxidase